MNTTTAPFGPLITAIDLANYAAGEFQRRQGLAQRAVNAGDWTTATATAQLRPWLAIACLAGADLPDLEEGLAELRICQRFGTGEDQGGQMGSRTDAQARAMLAREIAPRAQWQSALAAARDAAIRAEKPGPAANLRALCAALNVTTPYRERAEKA